MRFSPHFATETDPRILFAGDSFPADCLPYAQIFFRTIMEDIRREFDKPIHITSGYRSPQHNHDVGGVPTSQHIWSPTHCAVDFTIPGVALVSVFDWIRLSSRLPVDQLILERGQDDRHESDDCIHISMSNEPRYEALEGQTRNAGPYAARKFVKPEDWTV